MGTGEVLGCMIIRNDSPSAGQGLLVRDRESKRLLAPGKEMPHPARGAIAYSITGNPLKFLLP